MAAAKRHAACLILAAILTATPNLTHAAEPIYGDCAVDDQVPTQERAQYQRAAIAYVEALSRGDTESLRAAAAPEMWRGVPASEIDAALQSTAKLVGELSMPHVVHSYRVAVRRFGDDEIRFFPCRLSPQSSLKSEQERVLVAVRNLPLQAHVSVEASGTHATWAFTLWLRPNGDKWEVLGAHLGIASMPGFSPEKLLSLAQRERDAGRNLNARLLYSGAAGLWYRGPNLILGGHRIAVAEMRGVPAVPPFDTPPPWHFPAGERTFPIVWIAPLLGSEERKTFLEITVDSRGLADDEADRTNRALISAFKTAHPDYAVVFDGIVATAQLGEGRTFRTVVPTDRP